MSVINVNKDSFVQEVLNSETPVLVDFWAQWCGPCRAVAPVIESLAAEHAGHLKVVKVDIDANPELASAYGIRSIPAFKVFNKGSVELQLTGAMPKSQFDAALSGILVK